MTPSPAFKARLHEIIQEVMGEDDVWKTCVNCKQFNEDKELCLVCNPPSRPPARVIAFGCPAFEEADVQSGPIVTPKVSVPRTINDLDDDIPF